MKMEVLMKNGSFDDKWMFFTKQKEVLTLNLSLF